MKTQLWKKVGTSCMCLVTSFLFVTSTCATYSKAADLNLTYIGEATEADVTLTYSFRVQHKARRLSAPRNGPRGM